MNGRIYDPQLGRFLSADPVVQNPANLQWFNRYSYVINNPLRMTDPSRFVGSVGFGAMSWQTDDPQNPIRLDPKTTAEFSADIAGTFDPTPIVDLATAGYYISQGEYTEGVLTGLGAIPVVGDAVGKGLKWGIVKDRLCTRFNT